MFRFIDKFLSEDSQINLESLMEKGALVVDVRSADEYNEEHGRKPVNIPLSTLKNNLDKFKRNIPIITVCRTGKKSKAAVAFLREEGFEVYNGGSWINFP